MAPAMTAGCRHRSTTSGGLDPVRYQRFLSSSPTFVLRRGSAARAGCSMVDLAAAMSSAGARKARASAGARQQRRLDGCVSRYSMIASDCETRLSPCRAAVTSRHRRQRIRLGELLVARQVHRGGRSPGPARAMQAVRSRRSPSVVELHGHGRSPASGRHHLHPANPTPVTRRVSVATTAAEGCRVKIRSPGDSVQAAERCPMIRDVPDQFADRALLAPAPLTSSTIRCQSDAALVVGRMDPIAGDVRSPLPMHHGGS